MAMTTEELRVKLLDAKKAENELKSVRRELERTTGATSEHGKASQKAAESHGLASKAFGGLGNALRYGGGLLGIGAAAYGLKDLVQGGIKAQEQTLLLQQALRQTGQQGAGHLGLLNKAITQTTGAGGFGRLEETEGLAQFVRETKSATLAARDNREAITLARGAHESYATAVMQVQRIETGQVGRLQRYLGIIQPVKYWVDQLTASEKKRFPQKVKEAELKDKEATALEANQRIQERYGQAVVVYNKSAAGAVSNANNVFKNATETLGEKLLPAVAGVAKEFGKLVTEVSKGEGPFAAVEKDFEKVFKAVGGLYNFLKGHPELAQMLGYAGIAAGASHYAKKLPGAGAVGKDLKKVGKETEEHPYLLPTAVGAAIPFASAYGVHAGVEALSPGYLKARTLGEVTKAIAGVTGLQVPGLTELGGHAKVGRENPREAAAVARLLEHPNRLTPQLTLSNAQIEALERAVERGMASHNPEIHMDSTKVAEVLFRNPRARRLGAEGTHKHISGIQGRQ